MGHAAATLYIIMTLHGTMQTRQIAYEDVALCNADAERYTQKGLGLSWCVATPRIVIAH